MLVAVVVVICVVKKRRFNRVTLVSAHPTPIVNFIATPGTRPRHYVYMGTLWPVTQHGYTMVCYTAWVNNGLLHSMGTQWSVT